MKTKHQHIGLSILAFLTAFDDQGIDRAEGEWPQPTGRPWPKGIRP